MDKEMKEHDRVTAEIAGLRAELASLKEAFNTAIRSRDSVLRGLRIDCERFTAAARQDAEEKARLTESHARMKQLWENTKSNSAEEIARIKASAAEFEASAAEFEQWAQETYDDLHKQTTEEIARLTKVIAEIDEMPCTMVNDSESLRHTIKTIKHMTNAALACRPQEPIYGV